MKVPFVDLRAQTASIRAEVDAAIAGVIGRCDFVLGGAVDEFEKAFARFVGVSHAVGVASGLDALRLSLLALDTGPGDEVIVPANTFIATALAVGAAGARPVLVDCDESTYNIDPALIEQAITPRTKAIIPVHLTGHSAAMDAILEIADRRGLSVVEDACQAHGADHRGRKCGAMGIAGCFSFYPGKNLGCFGDGGMIVTDDERLAARLRRLRNYGQEVKYRHVESGGNSRLDTLQAAVLLVKLRHLPRWNELRRAHAAAYRERLREVEAVRLPSPEAAASTHVYHLFVVESERRDDLRQFLSERGIQTGIHYPVPIHLQPAYRQLGRREGDFPVSERLAGRMLSLPMFPELTDEQIDMVAGAISEWARHSA